MGKRRLEGVIGLPRAGGRSAAGRGTGAWGLERLDARPDAEAAQIGAEPARPGLRVRHRNGPEFSIPEMMVGRARAVACTTS